MKSRQNSLDSTNMLLPRFSMPCLSSGDLSKILCTPHLKLNDKEVHETGASALAFNRACTSGRQNCMKTHAICCSSTYVTSDASVHELLAQAIQREWIMMQQVEVGSSRDPSTQPVLSLTLGYNGSTAGGKEPTTRKIV